MIPQRPQRSERRRWASLAGTSCSLAALLLGGCGGGDASPEERPETTADSRDGRDDAPTSQPQGNPGPEPSPLARRQIPKGLLRLYIKTGRDLGLDWSIIASVDQIDLSTGPATIPTNERVPGIGYSLAATGSPLDDRAALVARAGPSYATQVLERAAAYSGTS